MSRPISSRWFSQTYSLRGLIGDVLVFLPRKERALFGKDIRPSGRPSLSILDQCLAARIKEMRPASTSPPRFAPSETELGLPTPARPGRNAGHEDKCFGALSLLPGEWVRTTTALVHRQDGLGTLAAWGSLHFRLAGTRHPTSFGVT